ncbi:class I SAM-dependent methyltransferase [Nonomuraea sp. NPDC050536]|uniref:class I SAM-dependent methyltransferase n=1 Tax=Nonomuraea sp. NPDC050536 TaxID=3364366 RepID=UPI0037C705BE
MNADKIDVRGLDDGGITWTLLGTLYLRAWESRNPRSILGDHYAAEAVDRLEYDFDALKRRVRPESNQYLVALRAKRLDSWSADFLSRHPDATVLQLGCGLDSRMLRLDPPPGVTWYDLDIPAVIDLRRRLYPERPGYHLIAASVTDPDWLAEIPAGRPVLIIAEGLLPYLVPTEVHRLLQRLTDHFAAGELIFDAGAPWFIRLMPVFHWGLGDGRDLERWNARLHRAEQHSFGAQWQLIPSGFYRGLYRWMDRLPGLRSIFQYYRFTF